MVESLKKEIVSCTLCLPHLAHGVRPVVQLSQKAKIAIAGQAPGRVVHETGVPFNDKSGDRLRDWLGVTRNQFYDPDLFAIVPWAFAIRARANLVIYRHAQNVAPRGTIGFFAKWASLN